MMDSQNTTQPGDTEEGNPLVFAIVADFVGMAILALGLAAEFADLHLIPPSLQFAGYGVFLIVLGALIAGASFAYIVSQRNK